MDWIGLMMFIKEQDNGRLSCCGHYSEIPLPGLWCKPGWPSAPSRGRPLHADGRRRAVGMTATRVSGAGQQTLDERCLLRLLQPLRLDDVQQIVLGLNQVVVDHHIVK